MMNRRMFAPLITSLVVCGLSIGIANAQPPGGGGGRGGRGGMMGGAMLLRAPEVQAELKLTDDQKTKLQAAQQEMGQKMRDMFQNSQGQDPEERRKQMAAMQEEQKKTIDSILTPDQQKRYNQLDLQWTFQMAPGMALSRPEVATALKLTDDQKKSLEQINSKSREDMQALMQGSDPQSMTQEERQAMNTKRQAIQKDTADKIQALLTDDQKKAWKDLTGDPFKFPPMRGFGGGRRGGGAPPAGA